MIELGRLGSGEVVVDRKVSHLHGPIAAILPEVLAMIWARGRGFLVEQVEFERTIGVKTCVQTGPGDDIVYLQRQGRAGLTRFVKGRQPEPSSSAVVILKKDRRSDRYLCVTAYIGERSEPEPWDPRATPESVSFWENHALIWGSESSSG